MALSAFRRGIDHRSTLPVTYQDHFSVLLHRSFSPFSPFSLPALSPLPLSLRHFLLVLVRRSLNLSTPLPSPPPPRPLFAFSLPLFFFFFSFSAGSTSLYLRRRIDSSSSFSFLFDVQHLRAPLSGRRSILLTRMCYEKLVASVRNMQHYFVIIYSDTSRRLGYIN